MLFENFLLFFRQILKILKRSCPRLSYKIKVLRTSYKTPLKVPRQTRLSPISLCNRRESSKLRLHRNLSGFLLSAADKVTPLGAMVDDSLVKKCSNQSDKLLSVLPLNPPSFLLLLLIFLLLEIFDELLECLQEICLGRVKQSLITLLFLLHRRLLL